MYSAKHILSDDLDLDTDLQDYQRLSQDYVQNLLMKTNERISQLSGRAQYYDGFNWNHSCGMLNDLNLCILLFILELKDSKNA